MPIAILDMVVIGVLLISGILAMVRGFTREVLAIASWALAGLAAVLFYKQLAPVFVVNAGIPEKFAMPAAAATIFLGALIVAYFVTAKLSDVILDSRIGALDRTLGFIFGFARGFLLMVVAFGLFEALVGEKQQPTWVAEAKTRPMLKSSFDKLKGILPDDFEQQMMSTLKKTGVNADPKGVPSEPAPQQAPAR